MVSVKPVCALALLIACRSDPGPLSNGFVTTFVNGTSVGVEGNVSTGGVVAPVFDETDATVTVTWLVTTGQIGDSSGQKGWMPSFVGAPGPVSTSLSTARSVSLICSPGPTRTAVLVGDGSSGFGGVPGFRSSGLRLTLNKI